MGGEKVRVKDVHLLAHHHYRILGLWRALRIPFKGTHDLDFYFFRGLAGLLKE